jgi:branched-chain amino acid transport system substrate-binding protein
MKIHMKNTVLSAVALTGTVALAACGSSAPAAPDADVERTYSAEGIQTFLDYTGSTAEAADDGADPVRIGWVNQDSGPGSLPELTALTQSAVDLVNGELGGIDGRPIELVTCEITSEETGQSCGQQFANDESILAIAQGNIAVGAESFHVAVDPSGIPIVGALPLVPQDGMAPNGFYVASGSFSTIPAMTSLLAGPIEGETVSIITIEGEAISSQIGAQLTGALRAAGKQVTQASLPMGSTDATAALVAAGVGEADVVIPLVILPQQCIAVQNALKSLGTSADVLALGACFSDGVAEALGDYPLWTYMWAYVNPDAPSEDPAVQAQIDAYQEWYEVLDQPMDGVIPLQTVLTLQRHILAAGGGDATHQSIAEAARAWTGPIFLGPPDVAYGSVRTFAPLPAIPSLQTRAYTYEGDDQFTDVTGGDWVG